MLSYAENHTLVNFSVNSDYTSNSDQTNDNGKTDSISIDSREIGDLDIPAFVSDDFAREEWARVVPVLEKDGKLTLAQKSLLGGYCNAIARAVRAEQILWQEGRYYRTSSTSGSVLRRRHPATRDVEEGWRTARRMARELGITSTTLCDNDAANGRRAMFK